MKDEPTQQIVLDYRGPAPRATPVKNWLRRLNDGEDTFLACSALLFALLTWLTAVLGRFMGDGQLTMCLSLPVAALSMLLGLSSLLERQCSRTFSLVSLGLNAAYFTWLFLGLGHR